MNNLAVEIPEERTTIIQGLCERSPLEGPTLYSDEEIDFLIETAMLMERKIHARTMESSAGA